VWNRNTREVGLLFRVHLVSRLTCAFGLLQKPKEPVPTLAPKTLSVAAAFNEDEDVSNKLVVRDFQPRNISCSFF